MCVVVPTRILMPMPISMFILLPVLIPVYPYARPCASVYTWSPPLLFHITAIVTKFIASLSTHAYAYPYLWIYPTPQLTILGYPSPFPLDAWPPTHLASSTNQNLPTYERFINIY